MQVTTRTGIACPPEQVFDTLADLRNDTQWNSRVSSAELLSGEPIGRVRISRSSTAALGTT